MKITLKKAFVSDSIKIHEMQKIGFKALLDKYQDFDTSPGAETIEWIRKRFQNNQIDHYYIQLAGESIGYIRIHKQDDKTCRLSQMFILPDYQEKGYAQQAIREVEKLNPQAARWKLDTIKQEEKLCHLYEKMGYHLTGTERNIKPGMDLVDYVK